MIDFEALRAARNESYQASMRKLCDELGWNIGDVRSTFNPDACYCACSEGGPCEHSWDGEPYESEDGCTFSATCSRCGKTAIGHDMAVMP